LPPPWWPTARRCGGACRARLRHSRALRRTGSPTT
jgi:hypothetical protein